jgi:hypothetical protein
MKFLFSFFTLVIVAVSMHAQDFGGDKVSIGNFVRRVYNSQPFNGVKVLHAQDGLDYLISVVELKIDLSKSESIQSRIASVKAKAYASQYINGSNVSTEVLVVATEERIKDSVINKTTIQEILKENSVGFVDFMELLTNFGTSDGSKTVYVFYRELKRK